MKSEFLAAAAMREITPDPAIINHTLHSVMAVRAQERGSPLRVKALALTWRSRTRLLLAADLVAVPGEANRFLRETLGKRTRLAFEDIVVSASHTHSSPFLEPVEGPHPFLDFFVQQSLAAAEEALRTQQPARIGGGVTHVVGASFNTRVPMPNDIVKFSRDFREGLASGRPVDSRLNVLRIDNADGQPIAGWVRFAAHPACVIFDAPISAEYPGYMTDRLTELVAGQPPFLFGYGASGDVNCIPMFGTESDSRNLGVRLAEAALPVFESIKTVPPRRFLSGTATVELPLDPPPSVETLDREIDEVEQFIAKLDKNHDLEWVMGINCKRDWPVEKKKAHVKPLADWARRAKQLRAAGHRFPDSWPRPITAWVIDDLGLVFDSGEALTAIGLTLSARSPFKETLLIAICNGTDAYLGTDEDRRRGGYETYTSTRYALWAEDVRPLPYALGAAEHFVHGILSVLRQCEARVLAEPSQTTP